MASLTIRNLPDSVRDALRVRAAQRGLSMEAEARAILAAAVQSSALERSPAASQALQDWISAHRKPAGNDQSSGGRFIREKRREAILEVIADGLDPAEVFGVNFTRILTEAGWTLPHVRKLRSKRP